MNMSQVRGQNHRSESQTQNYSSNICSKFQWLCSQNIKVIWIWINSSKTEGFFSSFI